MLRNFVFTIIILLFASFLQVTRVEASEGVVELGSINGSPTRCFAMSTSVNRSTNFLVVIRCRNLIYPVGPGMFYILWSNPIGLGKDSKPTPIGDIAFGDVSFNIQNSFSSLFITKEQTQSPSQPSNDRVMEGSVKPISFLEKEPTPTIIPSPTIKPLLTIELTPKITQAVTPTPKPKSGVSFLTIMQTSGILIIVIFILVGIFLVINKIRRS